METPGEEIKKKTKHETTRALRLQRETGQGTGEGKEKSDNQMPKRRQIRKPVQNSKSRVTELTGKTAESAPFCGGSPFQSSRHRNAGAETKKQICWGTMGCAENKPNPPPLCCPTPCLAARHAAIFTLCCHIHLGWDPGNFNHGASADSLFQGKAPSLPTSRPHFSLPCTHYTLSFPLQLTLNTDLNAGTATQF